MDIVAAIGRVIDRQNLDRDAMLVVTRAIMTGECTPAQIAALLVGLRMKGETVEEIAAAAEVMRELMTPVNGVPDDAVDIVGTGGDGLNTFNVSTAASFVAAAAGASVAKHGNRSVSSSSGSADVLERLGVRIDMNPDQVAQCVREVGVGFMFAPNHHAAMRYAVTPRREIKQRTLFNLLGPLTNPARVRRQVVGVFALKWVEPMARVLQALGSEHCLVVHADDGMDEFSIATATNMAELRVGQIDQLRVEPADFSIPAQALDSLVVSTAEESAERILGVLDGEPGPCSDIVALNAGAAIYVSGIAESFADGVELARSRLADGSGRARLQQLAQLTQELT